MSPSTTRRLTDRLQPKRRPQQHPGTPDQQQDHLNDRQYQEHIPEATGRALRTPTALFFSYTPWAGGCRPTAGDYWPTIVSQPSTAGGCHPFFCLSIPNSTGPLAASRQRLTSSLPSLVGLFNS
uniref:Uncharacterized protein n=1 Tax=Eutreptiella gymnastica TaxID=73025 RepID=A0A7S4LGR0_9EUGL